DFKAQSLRCTIPPASGPAGFNGRDWENTESGADRCNHTKAHRGRLDVVCSGCRSVQYNTNYISDVSGQYMHFSWLKD
ncbi:mannitol-1-phosphate dehydrogenase, partial [Moniliophthora roreri]